MDRIGQMVQANEPKVSEKSKKNRKVWTDGAKAIGFIDFLRIKWYIKINIGKITNYKLQINSWKQIVLNKKIERGNRLWEKKV